MKKTPHASDGETQAAPAVYDSLMAGAQQGQPGGLPGFREAHRQMVHVMLKAP